MNILRFYSQSKRYALLIGMYLLIVASCKEPVATIPASSASFAKDSLTVKDSVTAMAMAVAKDITERGPIAWLDHFEDAPGFWMASGGRLIFPNIDSAKQFIKQVLVKNVRSIDLRWSDLQVEPLSVTLASIGANFTEVITDISGKDLPIAGYFTGTARKTSGGWKLHNAHWSLIAK